MYIFTCLSYAPRSVRRRLRGGVVRPLHSSVVPFKTLIFGAALMSSRHAKPPPESNQHQRCRRAPTLSISHRTTCDPPLPATWTSGRFSSAAANSTTSRNSPATRAPRPSCLPLPQALSPRSPLTTPDFAAGGPDCPTAGLPIRLLILFPSGQKLRIAAFSATPGPVTPPRRCQICCYFPPPRDRSSKALRRRGAAERLSNYQLRRYQNELKQAFGLINDLISGTAPTAPTCRRHDVPATPSDLRLNLRFSSLRLSEGETGSV